MLIFVYQYWLGVLFLSKMSALKLSTNNKYQMSKSITDINNKTVHGLRNIAKHQDFCDHYKLTQHALIALFLEQMNQKNANIIKKK